MYTGKALSQQEGEIMDSHNGTTSTVEHETPEPPTTEVRSQPGSTHESREGHRHEQERSWAPSTPNWYPYALAAVVVLGFFVLTVLLILRQAGIHEGHKDIVFMLFGGLVTGFSMVLSYFFGSSAGSAQKTMELAKIAKSK
jgi:hypothetical protein